MSDAAGIILETVLGALSGLPQNKRGKALSTVLSELLNANGILMDGGMVQSPLAESPESVAQIAELLDNKPTLTRNKYYVYPFARPSISASGPFFYIDAGSGELMVLLVRRIKDSHQWLYTAGYMEVMPTNSDKAYSERVSESARNKAEEATIGVHLDIPDIVNPVAVIKELKLPEARAVQYIVYEEFRRISAQENWDSAVSKLTDVWYINDLLRRHRINWPEHVDFNSRSAFMREASEEAGLDLAKYPGAIIRMVKSIDTISLGSGGERLYGTDQLYFGYLGVLASAPKLRPGEYEICEARWIPVSDIYHARERNQYIIEKDGRPMHFNGIQGAEHTLTGLLNYFIAQVSKVQKPSGDYVPLLDNAASVQASLIHNFGIKFPAINNLADLRIGHEGNVPSLVHREGQAVFRSFIAAAKGLAEKKNAKELSGMIDNAIADPTALKAFA